ncbi:MAG: HupE/UreJ family protein [Stagnimonas sp.]|nr:HupE/UreJ family protein [Stagnimonas sp.]
MKCSTRLAQLASAAVLLLALGLHPARAHQFRSAYLQLSELGAGEYRLQLRLPWLAEGRLAPIELPLPADCEPSAAPESSRTESYLKRSSRWRCTRPLRGQELVLQGVNALTPDVMVELNFADGSQRLFTLDSDQPRLRFVPAQHRQPPEWQGYLRLGVEHILLGVDHLLFLTGLLLIVARASRDRVSLLLRTVTAFTLAHSLTLTASALGWLRLPPAAIEALIAASIVLLAVELTRPVTAPRLSLSKPWLPAFIFGLLHGFGFAGALAEVGLPEQARLPALAMFNLGVEVGQLLFAAALLSLLWLARRRLPLELPRLQALATQVIGSVAAFWLIDRTIAALA